MGSHELQLVKLITIRNHPREIKEFEVLGGCRYIIIPGSGKEIVKTPGGDTKSCAFGSAFTQQRALLQKPCAQASCHCSSALCHETTPIHEFLLGGNLIMPLL
jgi:hypothetical protein